MTDLTYLHGYLHTFGSTQPPNDFVPNTSYIDHGIKEVIS